MAPVSRANATANLRNGTDTRHPSRQNEPSSDATLRDSSPVPGCEEDDANGPRLITRQLTTARGKGKKRTRETDDPKNDILSLSRFIKRGIDTFVYIPQAINVGNAADTLKKYERLDPSDRRYKQEEKDAAEAILKNCGSEKDRLLKARDGIFELLADYLEYIRSLPAEEQEDLWFEVKDAADHARAYDTNKTKDKGTRYVTKSGVLDPPLEKDDKSEHGLKHPQMLRALVPMSFLYKHSKDPNFEKNVQDGKYPIDHLSMPAFLFDTDNYRPRSVKKTLLRGHTPLRVLKQIFTGPGSALEDVPRRKRPARPGNAHIAGQKEVTLEMIAYACIQARHYLTKLGTWGEWDSDTDFDKKAFYYQIVDFFEKRDSKWVKETLQWFNDKVFGPPQDKVVAERVPDGDDETSVANILASIVNDDDDEDDDNDDNENDDENGGSNNSNSNSNNNNNAERGTQLTALSQTQPDSQYERNAFRSQM